MCVREPDGRLRVESVGDPPFHVRGATKIYRRACWEQIAPLPCTPGWDTVDEVCANRHGWRTRSFGELAVVQHKATGSAYGCWPNAFKNGRANYLTGYHPAFMLAKCVKRVRRAPLGVEAAGLLAGFVSGYWKRLPRSTDGETVRYLRRQQVRRMLLRPSTMSARLGHRGPDADGSWTSPDRRVAFGHRRLSIIDLSAGGQQPMTDPGTGSVWIIFNGEIYNYRELRGELLRARPPLPHRERHRGHRPPLRGARHRLLAAPERHVRLRALGRDASSGCFWRATARHQAALLRAPPRRCCSPPRSRRCWSTRGQNRRRPPGNRLFLTCTTCAGSRHHASPITKLEPGHYLTVARPTIDVALLGLRIPRGAAPPHLNERPSPARTGAARTVRCT